MDFAFTTFGSTMVSVYNVFAFATAAIGLAAGSEQSKCAAPRKAVTLEYNYG